MLMVLSPAKTLDYTTLAHTLTHSQPDYLDHSASLIGLLRQNSPLDISRLMSISDQLAVLNVGRYHSWGLPFTRENAKQAVLAFMGDVYEGLDAGSLDEDDLGFAQSHLRILSGLYGLLRPLDLIQPYRLEMGTRLKNPAGGNLYDFWGDMLTEGLNALLERNPQPILLNLASEEYFKSVRPRTLNARIITPVFQDMKNGRYKIISFYAKRARGLMARHVIRHRLADPEALKAFKENGYRFIPEASDDKSWVFRREAQS